MLSGVYSAKKKDGTSYFRSSVTYKKKHISLGSFPTEQEAHVAYLEALRLLSSEQASTPEDYPANTHLPFSKWVVLTNFKNNGLYIKTPIYLRSRSFQYYLSPKDILVFDVDDLFFYSTHTIMRRGNHLFTADYGMQINIASRYGIKNFAVRNRDYRFINGDDHDFRYSNIEIINSYHGVSREEKMGEVTFLAKIHIHGDFIIGRYSSAIHAAIAYNKAIDVLKKKGSTINYTPNFITDLRSKDYAEIYSQLKISDKISSLDASFLLS